jgi:methionyl-tRNA formyltransferase
MRISLLCSEEQHPVNYYLKRWMVSQNGIHEIELVRRKNQLTGGDILFLISCSEIVDHADRCAYRASLVLHASDLPFGRGWSPHIWQLIEGANEISLSLLEANDQVDSGRIWKKIKFPIPKHMLWDEINVRLFEAEIKLIEFAISNLEKVRPTTQEQLMEVNYYPRRTHEDSRIDASQSIASQFNKIRVCDPNRFPAFFELYGKKYKLILEKLDE